MSDVGFRHNCLSEDPFSCLKYFFFFLIWIFPFEWHHWICLFETLKQWLRNNNVSYIKEILIWYPWLYKFEKLCVFEEFIFGHFFLLNSNIKILFSTPKLARKEIYWKTFTLKAGKLGGFLHLLVTSPDGNKI